MFICYTEEEVALFMHIGKIASSLSARSSRSPASLNRLSDQTIPDDDEKDNDGSTKKSVVIGSVGLSMHSDRRGAQVPLSSNLSADPLSAIADAVFVGVVFVGRFTRSLSCACVKYLCTNLDEDLTISASVHTTAQAIYLKCQKKTFYECI